MTHFGNWLGKSNADTMLAELLMGNLTMEQFRAVWTTYCIMLGAEPDTAYYDNKLREIYDCYWCFTLNGTKYYDEERDVFNEIEDHEYEAYDYFMGELLS